jgi:hypothetical protein
LYGTPNSSAISCIVNPFTVIYLLSHIVTEKSSKVSIISIQILSK